MMSHLDSDFPPKDGTFRERFIKELAGRAETIKKQEGSQITSGFDGEPFLAKWTAANVQVVQRPDDPQDILRISIGGGDHLPVSLNYCVIRGDRKRCIQLLQRAIKALEIGADGN